MDSLLGEYYPFWYGIKLNTEILDDFENPRDAGLLFFEALSTGPTAKHLDFIYAQPTEELKYLAINLFSLISHEGRHWMDIASTPFGYYINIQTLSFYLNAISALEEFKRAKFIRVPLNKNNNNDLKHLSSLINKNYELIDKIENWIDHSVEIGDKRITSVHILEALAILQQKKFIEKFLDPICLEIFLRKTKEITIYSYLIDYIQSNLKLDDLNTYMLLYYSLFGCKAIIANKKLDISPPAILGLFINNVKNTTDIKKQCDEILIRFQGYPSYASLFLSKKHATFHINSWIDKLKEQHNWNTTLDKLTSSVKEILELGYEIFNLIEKEPKMSLDNLIIGYVPKRSWPLIYVESLSFMISDNLPREVIISYIGYKFDSSRRNEIIFNTPTNLRSVVDTFLSGLPEDYNGIFNMHTLFAFIIDEPPPYFKLNDIFQFFLYFDILFKGKNSLKFDNAQKFIDRYVVPLGQEIVLDD